MEWLSQLITSFTRLFRWWIIVAPWEQGVRVRFGKESVLLLPGMHFRVPFLDRVYVVAVRLRMVQGRGQTATTLDGSVLTVGCAIQYGVRDAKLLFETIANPEATLMARVRAAIAEAVSEVDKKDLTRKKVQSAAEKAIPEEDWGLEKVSIRVIDFAFVRTYRLLQAHEHDEMRDLDHVLRNMDPDGKR